MCVLGCLSLYVSPAMTWRLVRGDPATAIENGWMFSANVNISKQNKAFYKKKLCNNNYYKKHNLLMCYG